MRLIVDEAVSHLPSITYMMNHMEKYDLSKLSEMNIRFKPESKWFGIWGVCRMPYKYAATEKCREYYRITCNLSGMYGEDEYPSEESRKRHKRRPRIEGYASSYDELILWIMAHEFAHFLVDTKQDKKGTHDENYIDSIAWDMWKTYKKEMV